MIGYELWQLDPEYEGETFIGAYSDYVAALDAKDRLDAELDDEGESDGVVLEIREVH